MAGKRKTPKLRFDGRYYVVNFYRPDGKRSMISFGPEGERTEGEVLTAFGKWLDLFNQVPHKVLSYDSPYEAIEEITNPSPRINVGELLDYYHSWANKTLPPLEGKRQQDVIVRTERVKNFMEEYLQWPVENFGPDELRKVVEAMKDYRYTRGKKELQYTRRGINDNLKQILTIWRWGVGREFVKHSHAIRLEEIKPLRLGQGIENQKRPKITQREFDKVVDQVNSVVADMLRLMWYTAMRPGEVCKMRPFDILRDDPQCWLYVPGRDKSPVGDHKTTRFGRMRVITLTAEAQKILEGRITNFKSKAYVFKPIDAIEEMYDIRAQNRVTPMSCGNKPGTNRKEHPMIKPGECYTANALRIACQRGCKRAGVEPFKPYDLRRSVATATRARLGKEAAKVLLGHTKTDTTDIYLLDEVQEAMKIAKQLAVKE